MRMIELDGVLALNISREGALLPRLALQGSTDPIVRAFGYVPSPDIWVTDQDDTVVTDGDEDISVG